MNRITAAGYEVILGAVSLRDVGAEHVDLTRVIFTFSDPFQSLLMS